MWWEWCAFFVVAVLGVRDLEWCSHVRGYSYGVGRGALEWPL